MLTTQERSKRSNERSPLWTTIPWGEWKTYKDPLKFGTEDGKQYFEGGDLPGKHYKKS